MGVAIAVLLLGAFVSMRKDTVSVRVARVEQGKIRSVVSTNGKVEPLQSFEAHAPVATTRQTSARKGRGSSQEGAVVDAT